MESPLQDFQTSRINRFIERLSALQCIKYFVVMVMLFKVFQVVFTTSILLIKRNEFCIAPLKLFLTVYVVLVFVQGILFFMKNREYFNIDRLPDVPENNEIGLFNNFIDAFSLFWCLTGFHWTQECKICRISNPLLYWTSIAWSYYGMFIIVSPLIAIVLLICIITYFRPKLPVIEYNNDSQIPKQDANCSICLNDYNPKEMIKILPCDHHFHEGCIDEWFNIDDICPLCKKPINLLYDLVEQPMV
ncbi:E3 ubiquitin-protein ligase [Dictyocoela muelleri]|nr:E3 ubiquitin-protein ligase [Dictyocoela muelleri]